MQSKKEKIRILKEEIKMIRSHQNITNYYDFEDMIAARILMIMELQGVKIEKE